MRLLNNSEIFSVQPEDIDFVPMRLLNNSETYSVQPEYRTKFLYNYCFDETTK